MPTPKTYYARKRPGGSQPFLLVRESEAAVRAECEEGDEVWKVGVSKSDVQMGSRKEMMRKEGYYAWQDAGSQGFQHISGNITRTEMECDNGAKNKVRIAKEKSGAGGIVMVEVVPIERMKKP